MLTGLRAIEETHVNGSLEKRVAHNLNVSFAFVEGESLMMAIKDLAVSSGSACTSASLEPSYVLRAIGRPGRAGAQLDPLSRFGRTTTEAEIDRAVALLTVAVAAAARAVAALGHASGRRRSRQRAVGGALIPVSLAQGQLRCPTATKSWTTTRTHATSASFDKNDASVGTGMVGAPACGDVMRLQIKVSDAGVIEDAKFKTYGCGSAIASSSLVTEWLKGKTRVRRSKSRTPPSPRSWRCRR